MFNATITTPGRLRAVLTVSAALSHSIRVRIGYSDESQTTTFLVASGCRLASTRVLCLKCFPQDWQGMPIA
ncbi:hypothetical protein M405DRAFT_815033 [Rhizopogon salebrosus TDB-379]|nr:hypothetical protein M405DRAFT_815033 [Rhizopogon salebrosus TDB-379]